MKNSPHDVQTKGGGGLLDNVKKNCTFLTGWLPLDRDLGYLISRYLYVSHFLISPPSAVKPLTTSARAKSQTEGLEKDLKSNNYVMMLLFLFSLNF